jgi:hypothetical protein
MASNASSPMGCEKTLILTLEEPREEAPACLHHGLYAYGVVRKDAVQRSILGIDKRHSVYAVNGKDLAVMVSEIDIAAFQKQVKSLFAELTTSSGQGRAETLLQAHEESVDALLQDTTVVPFKFGTVLKDEQAALKMLKENKEKFQKLLAKLSGKVEWGLKVYVDKQTFTHFLTQSETPRNNQNRAPLSRGAAYLLAKKMEEEVKDNALARLSEISEAIFQAASKDVYEARLNTTLPQKLTGKKMEMVLNAAYLLEQEKVANFCEQGKKLKEKYAPIGLDIEVSGPWPPYNFT